MTDLGDLRRRDKISKTGLIIGLTAVALACGHLIDQPGLPLALSAVGLVLLFAAVILGLWRSDP
jgi:hypothetical protein